MTMDSVFTVPEADLPDMAQLGNCKRDKHQEIYDKLKEAVNVKIRVMADDVWGELESH